MQERQVRLKEREGLVAAALGRKEENMNETKLIITHDRGKTHSVTSYR